MSTHVLPEQLRHIVEAAGLAPSVHNTQPWRFMAAGNRLELYADSTRQLEVLDPDGRQLHLSCGASLLHAEVAARALGLDPAVTLLPDPNDPGHLADVVLSRGEAATPGEVRLAEAILHRHTHRGAFEPGRLPEAVVDLLALAAATEGAHLDHVADEDQLIELEVMLARANELEEHDPRYASEVREWVRDDETADDGIPVTAVDVVAGSTLRQRDFGTQPTGAAENPPTPDKPTVVVLTSDDDTPESWLRAGKALAVVLLRAADLGVQAQPLGQVTDVIAYRLGLRRVLGILGMPQLVLRMGYASARAQTPRRSVDAVLSCVAD